LQKELRGDLSREREEGIQPTLEKYTTLKKFQNKYNKI